MHSLAKFIVQTSWGISALAFMISSKTLMAGHSVGGGGTGVACFDTNGRVASIETYDFFFGRKLGRVISLESNSQDYRDIAKVSLDRLAVLSPMRAKTYQDQIAMFENPSESSFLSDSSIFHVPDLGQPALEPGDGCKYVQIIYQQEPRFPKDKRYLVNKYYWDLLPPLQKAGLVLHEVIYREAMSYGHTDSSGAREFNLTFADPDAATMTYRDFIDLLKSIPFIKTDYFGLSVELGQCFKSPVTGRPTCQSPMDLEFWDPNLLFYPSGNLQRISGQLSVGTKIQLKYHTIGENESGRLTLTFRDSKNSIIHNIYSSDGLNILELTSGNKVGDGIVSVQFFSTGEMESIETTTGSFREMDANHCLFLLDMNQNIVGFQVKKGGHINNFDFFGLKLGLHGEADYSIHREDKFTFQEHASLQNPNTNGKVFLYVNSQELNHQLNFDSSNNLESSKNATVDFRPKSICYTNSREFAYRVIFTQGIVEFYQSGYVKSGTYYGVRDGYNNEVSLCLRTESGKEVVIPFHSPPIKLNFNEKGFLQD